MNISYLGQPVQNLDYTYWIGDTWTNPTTAKNGLGYIELTGNTASSFNDIRIRTEYKYSANSRIDLELQSVLENTNTPFFKLSESKISIIKNIQETKLEVKSQNINLSDGTVEYEKTIEKIRNAINDNKYESVKSLFTDDGFKMYEKLITYGKAKVLPQKHDILFVKLNNEVVARSLPMTFTFTNNNKKFIEEVVFSFDSNKKISTISFSLGAKAISDISKMPDAFGTTENKYQIVQFMEGYKTAYCLKNIDYIENIFADNALIIVGHLLKQDKPIDNMYGSLGDNVKYVKLKKSEYIENLKRVFNSSEFVNIQFDENNVKKINGKKIYGIQIAQNYYSSSYADKGFLFLMFDLEDDKNPKIYVRTWQPQKNPDGSIFGLSDFTIE